MIYKSNHYSVKDILSKNPVPYTNEYYGPFGLKKGAQRKWCRKMIRAEGKRITLDRLAREAEDRAVDQQLNISRGK